MQYNYVTCELPSNGKIYSTKAVHLRPKTIFDIKSLLGQPTYYLKDEIDTLQNCIDPRDNVNVYDLVKQDVVYLLYKLRSLSDDLLLINYNNKQYEYNISDLKVKYLNEYNPTRILPDSGEEVTLSIQSLGDIFNFSQKREDFLKKYPNYNGNVDNTVNVLSSISSIGNVTNEDHLRNALENLSWKDSVYLINEIEKFQQNEDFGIEEEVTITVDDKEVKLPIEITEKFFRPAL